MMLKNGKVNMKYSFSCKYFFLVLQTILSICLFLEIWFYLGILVSEKYDIQEYSIFMDKTQENLKKMEILNNQLIYQKKIILILFIVTILLKIGLFIIKKIQCKYSGRVP